MIGLELTEKQIIKDIISQFDCVEKVILFGSRALNTHKKTSDIDLALFGKIDINTLAKIKYQLEEKTNLPYFFDVIIYENIKNEKLKEHIDRFGMIL